jgi:hypothetical protein
MTVDVDVKQKAREVSATMARFARELASADNRVAVAEARRATVVAAQDRVVADAGQDAARVVARMVAELGATLTAALTGRTVTAVKAAKGGGV